MKKVGLWGCAGGGAGGERERVPRRIDGGRGMTRRRKAAEEATKRGIRGRGVQPGPRNRGETRGIASRARGRREEAAAREAGRWDCRALF